MQMPRFRKDAEAENDANEADQDRAASTAAWDVK